ncbi:MAG: phosphodiester glycosidase family protein [Clostridia bacterium]|nr:phosphodiester glycosidase family protein [Clostridia bacterium]
MSAKKCIILFLAVMLVLPCFTALAEGFDPLPMNNLSFGAKPKNENYLSNTEYQDESISVKIYEGRFADTDYACAHVKISHPSQLRTIPAAVYQSPKAAFVARASEANFKGRFVANKVNAVVALNGDFYTKTKVVQVVLRQGKQVRNISEGKSDLLVIDMNGNFSYLPLCSKEDYQAYYEENQQNMYQVFCFGPALVENGVSRIDESYLNKDIGSQNNTQRSAIAQIAPLEYLLITCNGPQTKNNKGMTIYEFAALCEKLGKELNEDGCELAYNLDGGNSSTLVFKKKDAKTGKLSYVKYNCPEIERFLGDVIYFATLVK